MLAGALLVASAAAGQVPGEEIARRAFEDGVALEKKGDYAGALAKFRESEQIKATLGNRYHKAYCLEMTGKLAAAFAEYEALDKAARDANKSELVEATRLRLEPLRARVPQLSLTLSTGAPKETEVSLDGTPVSPALLDGKAFRVDPGDHVIAARAADREPFTKSFAAGESTTTSVEIVLPALATPTGAAHDDRLIEPPAEAPHERSIMLPIATTAGAVVLAAGGIVSYLLSANAQDDLEQTCSTKRNCDDEKRTIRTLDAVALGAWIGAAGLSALSVVLWTSKPTSTASALSRTSIVARGSWLGMEGRF